MLDNIEYIVTIYRNFQYEFQAHTVGLHILLVLVAPTDVPPSWTLYPTHICRVTDTYRWPTELDPLSDTHPQCFGLTVY